MLLESTRQPLATCERMQMSSSMVKMKLGLERRAERQSARVRLMYSAQISILSWRHSTWFSGWNLQWQTLRVVSFWKFLIFINRSSRLLCCLSSCLFKGSSKIIVQSYLTVSFRQILMSPKTGSSMSWMKLNFLKNSFQNQDWEPPICSTDPIIIFMPNQIITVMAHLYHQSHDRHYQHALRQEQERIKIKRQINSPKTCLKSNQILTQKFFAKLERYPDQDFIGLKESLPLLFEMDILHILKSIEEAKSILSRKINANQCSRLKTQAKFVSYLWKAIGTEMVSCLEFKRIVFLFHEKRGKALKQILEEMFDHEERQQKIAAILYQTWNEIQVDRFYYRQKCDKSKERIKTVEDLDLRWSRQKKFECFDKSKDKVNIKIKDRSSLNHTMECSSGNKQKVRKHEKQNQTSKPIHQRLYETEFYRKKEKLKDENKVQRQREALNECTFKPKINNDEKMRRSRSSSRCPSLEIKGFDKTINRLKEGHKKQSEEHQKKSYIPVGENYAKMRSKEVNAPSFLARKKGEKEVQLFSMAFEIGSKKAMIKIRQKDTPESAAEKICQIYGLNRRLQGELQEVIREELEEYWKQN